MHIRAFAVTLLATLCFSARADIDFPGDPVPLATAKGKVGPLRVTLPERSPLSTPKAVIARMHLPRDTATDDYDWAKEVYDLWVPKEPDADGKYGLMVGAVFKDYGAPPGDWADALDKHHVIWICSETVGDGQSDPHRVGTMLDAVHNVSKAYPIRENRTYASMGGGYTTNTCGAPWYYADVFDGGALFTIHWKWFAKVPAPKGYAAWPAELPAPDADQLAFARAHGRYFFVRREGDSPNEPSLVKEIATKALPAAGLTRTKLIYVTGEQMGHYGAYDPIIFEQGIAFLDAPLATIPSKTAAAKTPDAAPPAKADASAPPKPAPAPPAATADESSAKAAKDLSMAKNYLTLQKYDAARPKLEKIVHDYPGTPAAKEAKELLKQIEGK